MTYKDRFYLSPWLYLCSLSAVFFSVYYLANATRLSPNEEIRIATTFSIIVIGAIVFLCGTSIVVRESQLAVESFGIRLRTVDLAGVTFVSTGFPLMYVQYSSSKRNKTLLVPAVFHKKRLCELILHRNPAVIIH